MSPTSLVQLYRNARSALDRAGALVDARDAPNRLRRVFDQVTNDINAEAAAGAVDDLTARRRSTLSELLRATTMGALGAIRAAAPPLPAVAHPPRANDGWDLWSWLRGGPSDHDVRSQVAVPASPFVDLAGLGDQLEVAFDIADHVLALAGSPEPKVVVAPWSADPELLELFQDLLEARLLDDGALALSHVERLRRALPLRHGVEVVVYDGSNPQLFQRGVDCATAEAPRTVRPALVVDGRAVRKGEVRMPVVVESEGVRGELDAVAAEEQGAAAAAPQTAEEPPRAAESAPTADQAGARERGPDV